MTRRQMLTALFGAAVLTLPMAGCGNQPVQDEPGAELILRYAENQPEDYPTTQAALAFADLVAQRTDGRVKVLVYSGGELGAEQSVIQQMQFGGIDFSRVSLSHNAISWCSHATRIQTPFNANPNPSPNNRYFPLFPCGFVPTACRIGRFLFLIRIQNSATAQIPKKITRTGSNTAVGVILPVLPTESSIFNSLDSFSSGGYLYAIAQRGTLDVSPNCSRSEKRLIFTTAPSISYVRFPRFSPIAVIASHTSSAVVQTL